VTTITLEMVVPAVIGLYIDRQLGTVMVFLMLGVVLGLTMGIRGLVQLTKAMGTQPGTKGNRQSSDRPKE